MPIRSGEAIFAVNNKRCLAGERAQQRVLLHKDDDQGKNHEQDAQSNRDPEQCLFNATPGSEDTTSVVSGQPTQANAFAL